MIHTNNPEINVEELMQRIRAEVAERKAAVGVLRLTRLPKSRTTPRTQRSHPIAVRWKEG